MKRHLYLSVCALCISFILACFPTSTWAKDRGLGFILDDKGAARKVYFHTRKKLSLSFDKNFPLVERTVALSIRETDSDRETVRIKLDPKAFGGLAFEGYALDADRIVLNGPGIVVWDWRKNQLRTYKGAASGSPESISGISPDEKFAISASNFTHGLVFHDFELGTSIRMYDGEKVLSPRFSPDGTQWAFFTKKELILRWTGGNREIRVALPSKKGYVHARHLAWSPSGRYIAGLIYPDHPKLVIWDSGGNHLKTVSVPYGTTSWPPVWASDEKGVYIVLGYEGRFGKLNPLQLKLIPLW